MVVAQVGTDGELAQGGGYGGGDKLDSGCILKVEPLLPNPASWPLPVLLPPGRLPSHLIPERSSPESGAHGLCPPR